MPPKRRIMAARKPVSKRGRLTRERIQAQLDDPRVKQAYEEALQRRTEASSDLVESVRSAERLDEKDFSVRINAKG